MADAQRVIITAAGAGIGRATALSFAAQGARVHVCDIDQAALDDLVAENPDIVAARVDVGEEAAVDDWLENALKALGGLDVLVNNAGIAGPTAPVEEMTLADWRKCVQICLDSHFLTCRRCVPVMKQQRFGSIINISSGAGLVGYPFRTPYASAKWAVIGFSKSIASEVGPYNVRCNAICPGAVTGARIDRVIAAEARASGRSEEQVRADYTNAVSMRRFVTAQEIADMALFLASPASAMVSGQALAVDGNMELYSSD